MSGNAARLAALTRDLFERWRQTRSDWRDTRALQFEKDHLEPLEDAVKSAVRGITELEALLQQIRRDCE
jgi:hypothetical protein